MARKIRLTILSALLRVFPVYVKIAKQCGQANYRLRGLRQRIVNLRENEKRKGDKEMDTTFFFLLFSFYP